jgi:hypothetical protein
MCDSNPPTIVKYTDVCPSIKAMTKGYGGITVIKKVNDTYTAYTCCGFSRLETKGISFSMTHMNTLKLMVNANIHDTTWILEVILVNQSIDFISADTQSYFYIYRAFLSSIIEFLLILKAESQLFNNMKCIEINKVDDILWNLFQPFFLQLKMKSNGNSSSITQLKYPM